MLSVEIIAFVVEYLSKWAGVVVKVRVVGLSSEAVKCILKISGGRERDALLKNW